MLLDQIDWSDPASIARVQDYLRQKHRRKYSHVDEHLLEASIEDALMHYKRCPQSFDASRGASLYSYLELWTRHYLDKRLQKVKRRRQHEKSVGVSDNFFERIVSEVTVRRGIYRGKNRTQQEDEVGREELERRKEALGALVALLNPHDRAGLELLRTGASREEWVRHLGIEHLTEKEQQRKVNVEKDRLKKKLKRWAQKMQGGGNGSLDRVQIRATCFEAGGERESWRIQLKMPYVQQGDGSIEGKCSRASCSFVSVCCCS